MDVTGLSSGNVITVKELADYLRCHTSTVYRLLKRNELPAFKIGSDWRFNREAIDTWLRERSFYPSRDDIHAV
ncbi:MAG TPA: helix-turn-helix domain-containing protein [Candidatus Binataceae bacterium]|nr:helix-turn-helix domain-containing protein [Candidatus Binataceae bacterium]